jgi:ornithine cyclodeaminase/alanine dehydrogenase-like protein (mu-crystallin family)
MREIPDAVYSETEQVFVDTLHGLSEAGDLLEPLKKKLVLEEQIISISDLILGKTRAEGGTRLFKSVGMAAFDLYGAKLIFENLS